jgi:OPT family oligopeptide transporter
MVTAALTSFALAAAASWRRSIRKRKRASRTPTEPVTTAARVSGRHFVAALIVAGGLSVVLQCTLFDIRPYAAICAVVLTFALAIVAGRVTGETGIAPIGAMGKVTQLVFAGLAPANPTANLMSANVTGGAASQCSDMLHDLKTGFLLGSWPRHQALAQLLGVLSGALCGSAAYLLLVPDPATQLVTAEWPAPAVAQWKAVAEVFSQGIGHMPPGATLAALIAGSFGVVLAVLDRLVPTQARAYVPSAASVGLAFVLPAHYSISVFLGGVLAWAFSRIAKSSAERFSVVIAAGLIAGESLVGVVFAM